MLANIYIYLAGNGLVYYAILTSISYLLYVQDGLGQGG